MIMNTKAKVLVLGGDGMAGHMIASYLAFSGHDVHTTTRGRSGKKNYHFDVLEYEEFAGIVKKAKPEYVVNCIGILNAFAENFHSEAVLINSFFSHFADSLSEKFGYRLIHMSTDCVFSGKKGRYAESDLPDETSFYGRSKALGEIDNARNLTLRTSIVGPDRNANGIGLFHWFMKQSGEIRGFDKVIWSGVTTLQFAKSIEMSFGRNVSGLFHLVNNESISKHDLLCLFRKYMKREIHIKKEKKTVCDKSIRNTRGDFDFKVPSYDEMIADMCDWIFKNKGRYPLYFKD